MLLPLALCPCFYLHAIHKTLCSPDLLIIQNRGPFLWSSQAGCPLVMLGYGQGAHWRHRAIACFIYHTCPTVLPQGCLPLYLHINKHFIETQLLSVVGKLGKCPQRFTMTGCWAPHYSLVSPVTVHWERRVSKKCLAWNWDTSQGNLVCLLVYYLNMTENFLKISSGGKACSYTVEHTIGHFSSFLV